MRCKSADGTHLSRIVFTTPPKCIKIDVDISADGRYYGTVGFCKIL